MARGLVLMGSMTWSLTLLAHTYSQPPDLGSKFTRPYTSERAEGLLVNF